MLYDSVREIVKNSLRECGFTEVEFSLERPVMREHGDFATNVALKLRAEGKGDVSEKLAAKIQQDPRVARAEVAQGFINIFLKQEIWYGELEHILKRGGGYGIPDIGRGERVQVEFISANPTGPLTLGNARGGFVGDVIANVLSRLGFDVTREYYFNDAGTQVRNLVASVRAHATGTVSEETQYRGAYIDELAKEFAAELEAKTDYELGALLMRVIFDRWIKPAIDHMGVRFDVWFNERSLVESGAFDRAVDRLRSENIVYEKDGALWLASQQLGDERDRVLKKSNGDITYLGDDIAYHLNIFEER